MPPVPDLTVRNLIVRETPGLGLGGRIERRTVIQFHVGIHGPYMIELPSSEATPQRMKQLINEKVQALHELLADVQPSTE